MFVSRLVSAVLGLSTFALAGLVTDKETSFKSSIAEKLLTPPAGWVEDPSARIDKDVDTITLRIHLVQQDLDKFQQLAIDIATPGHELYGSHLAQHVIDDMIAPKDESHQLVMQWLESEGLKSEAIHTPRSDSILVQASISQIEKLLNADYKSYVRSETGATVVRTLEYSLPDILKGHVDMVQPTTFFGLKSLKSHLKNVRPAPAAEDTFKTDGVEAVTGCTGTTITPTCLSHLYSFSGATAYTQGIMGIAGFLEQWPSQTDLTTFLKTFASEGNSPHAYTCTLINGGECPTSGTGFPGVEANLDTQYAAAITEKIPNVFFSTGGSPPIVAGSGANTNEPYLEFLDALLALPANQLPNTLSISYGDDESTVPLSYAQETCSLFSQLGTRGVSILVSAGDSGVGTTCDDGGVRGFTTSYPASCPFVTVVGGTTGNSPEAAWTDGGGGFSDVFARPSYQNAAVTNWLATDTTHTANNAFFNSSGRAYPDVAAQSTDFEIVVSGRTELVDGTSCSAPTFGSIIQLINSDRLSKGKTGLGFLNPWLYSSATSGLTDIKSGKITGCAGVISGAGFNAVTGWDPATGLGTPIFTSLLTISNAT